MANKTYPFKNLVFKGGGIRGIAYIGALEELYARGIMDNIDKIAGSSAGAITALVTALGFDYQTTVDICNSLDFKKVPGIPSFFATRGVDDAELSEESMPRGILDAFQSVGTTMTEIRFLFHSLGLHTSTYIYEWFGEQVAKITGDPTSSFQDFVDKGGKDLYITVTNLSNHSSHICSAATTPDLEVAEAVRTSMSIPVFFESIAFENIYLKGYFGDGGVMNNFPITLFDEGTEPNPETLGLFLFKEVKPQTFPSKYSLKQYIGDMVFSMMTAQDWNLARQGEDLARSIQISDCDIHPTNFDIKFGDPEYYNLVDEGKKGTKLFLDAYDTNDMDTLMKPRFIPDIAGFE